MGEMKEICEKEGIKLHTSVRYSPESNGVAERTIGVLTNVVRAMLHDSGLPKFLWAEAFNAATYVHNRTPTKALGGRTPFEVLYGTKPELSHLRAFGAPCKERLRKLDDQATMCFFVGYKYEGGGYRVWDPKRRVVVESRDILFFEDGLPPPTLGKSHPQHDDEDNPVVQPPPEHVVERPTPPTLPTPPTVPGPTSPPTETTTDHAPTQTPHPRITIRLPGRLMNRSHVEAHEDEPDERPVHDVSYVPDYPERSTRSGLTRNRRGGGGNAMLTSYEAGPPQIAFSAGLPGGIQAVAAARSPQRARSDGTS